VTIWLRYHPTHAMAISMRADRGGVLRGRLWRIQARTAPGGGRFAATR
jgi:hypothetical protein